MSDAHGTTGPSRLFIIRTVDDGVTVLSLQGEVDMHTAHRLRQALAADHAGLPARVVVDFRRVTFMDSSGINALICLYRATRDTPGWVRLAGIQPCIQRVLELSGLAAVFDCFPTVHRALVA
ncbi:hypothetical protein GCM10010358_82260 [Streptomyces minutiscleroticus]|uniref:Anti-sigma factor antagonist n=1 Tax=Streptomyces minutiscleroticus TaxID=68238 RepID=A0A918UAS4_9ACTN|nr:STAS domain-containing protein [Streptomyces minutiscleroticus]GGY18634.1 hypothetical protein GCM10010358_82260 [Streptomyces minutiscleroticus]